MMMVCFRVLIDAILKRRKVSSGSTLVLGIFTHLMDWAVRSI